MSAWLFAAAAVLIAAGFVGAIVPTVGEQYTFTILRAINAIGPAIGTQLVPAQVSAAAIGIPATVAAGKTAAGGMMINSSRAILFATAADGEDFAQAARRVAQQTRDEINLYR